MPSCLLYSWVGSLLARGWSRPLTLLDLPDLNPTERAAGLQQAWQRAWDKVTSP